MLEVKLFEKSVFRVHGYGDQYWRIALMFSICHRPELKLRFRFDIELPISKADRIIMLLIRSHFGGKADCHAGAFAAYRFKLDRSAKATNDIFSKEDP